ncbi:hypothetical protein [Corallococcus sp. EGB]|uniref:hypothetical protein n=1 Tax=Corallococcus sp. EGB TaxID=1521117 RepID=UPI001CBC6B44|nr:hypothetical protein [Corallococcus sp. EGB]
MRASIVCGLVATALMVGCGAPVEQEEEPQLGTQESPIPDCSGYHDAINYYSDAAHTTLIGIKGCYCGSWSTWGRTSAFSEPNLDC